MVLRNKNFQIAAAEILATAVLEIFPKAKFYDVYPTEIGFGVDCLLESPLDDEGFQLIDERMRILMKQDLMIESVEMMRENAAELFRHQGQEFLAKNILKDSRNIVPLVRIGKRYGYNSPEGSISSKELGQGKLFQYSLDGQRVRFEGVLCQDSRGVKKFLKDFEEAKKSDYKLLGPELQLFFEKEGDLILLPRGVKSKEFLVSWLRKCFKKGGYSLVSLSYLSDQKEQVYEIFEILSRSQSKFAEVNEQNRFYSLCQDEQVTEELNSSLQFIRKSINILPIDYRWYLVSPDPRMTENRRSGKKEITLLRDLLRQCECSYEEDFHQDPESGHRIEARFIDSLGREWAGPKMELSLQASGKPHLVSGSIVRPLEQLIALLLKSCQGVLPLWLSPEQVRVIPVGEKQQKYAEEVSSELNENGFRVEIEKSGEPLAIKIYRAKSLRIPYVIVVGEREEQNGTIVVRSYRDRETEEQEALKPFIERLRDEITEKLE